MCKGFRLRPGCSGLFMRRSGSGRSVFRLGFSARSSAANGHKD